jgi:hypothetical protein
MQSELAINESVLLAGIKSIRKHGRHLAGRGGRLRLIAAFWFGLLALVVAHASLDGVVMDGHDFDVALVSGPQLMAEQGFGKQAGFGTGIIRLVRIGFLRGVSAGSVIVIGSVIGHWLPFGSVTVIHVFIMVKGRLPWGKH